jgi:soluble lytic murein transglycosylase-like protein
MFRRFLATAVLATFLLDAAPAGADIYRWTDADGVVHFTDNPRPNRKWKRIMRTGPGKAASVRGIRGRRRKADPGRFTRFDQHIREAAALYHIPEPLIRAVISVESDYEPNVVSHKGAKGLMQLMPAVCEGMGVTNVFNPRQNIFGGTRLLRILANQFGGDLVLTLAGYHAGAGAVKKYLARDYKIPPYQTTHAYIRMVLSRYYKLKHRLQQQAAKESSSSSG